jgi:undecaprenyl diphosphate synthase
MELLRTYLKEALEKFKEENIKIKFIGDRTPLDRDIKALIREAEESSANASGLVLNIALNYGGRQEIAAAAAALAKAAAAGFIKAEDINEAALIKHLYTAGQPDPDLVIMPGGEFRISNFLLWQCAYAEYWFSPLLWPDFTADDLDKAIESFGMRNRRFGGIR